MPFNSPDPPPVESVIPLPVGPVSGHVADCALTFTPDSGGKGDTALFVPTVTCFSGSVIVPRFVSWMKLTPDSVSSASVCGAPLWPAPGTVQIFTLCVPDGATKENDPSGAVVVADHGGAVVMWAAATAGVVCAPVKETVGAEM